MTSPLRNNYHDTDHSIIIGFPNAFWWGHELQAYYLSFNFNAPINVLLHLASYHPTGKRWGSVDRV